MIAYCLTKFWSNQFVFKQLIGLLLWYRKLCIHICFLVYVWGYLKVCFARGLWRCHLEEVLREEMRQHARDAFRDDLSFLVIRERTSELASRFDGSVRTGHNFQIIRKCQNDYTPPIVIKKNVIKKSKPWKPFKKRNLLKEIYNKPFQKIRKLETLGKIIDFLFWWEGV